MPKSELGQNREILSVLGQQVLAGNSEVGGSVGYQLGDVFGPHEQKVEVYVADAYREGAIRLLEIKAGVG
jgi:hypothetical protein